MSKFITIGKTEFRTDAIVKVRKTDESFGDNPYSFSVYVSGCPDVEKYVYNTSEMRDKVFEELMEYINEDV